MCRTIKVLFLLAIAIYVCAAQITKSQSCLCRDGVKSFVQKYEIKDITIHPASTFCNNVEIVVSTRNGSSFCLKSKAVTRILANLTSKK
ncbi:C-X-C motif chemokine 11-1-like [Syngnathus scovelli]|uniref:C-X-C motif chemokine 11-1-like n=1 Tax=Syngnathus scovelli TaxID=161590 RepID=UPI0035CA3915